MPKSFLLKRRSVNGMVKLTARPSNKQADKGVAEEMNASSKPDQKVQEVTQYGLRTEPRPPSITFQVDAQDRNIFSTRETAFDKDFSHLYIYNPLYHFLVPDALRSVHENDTAVFNNMHAYFSYLQTTSSEHSESLRSNAIGYLPVVSYVGFSGENYLASPSKALIPKEVREPYRCDQCGKVFKTKYTLAIHLKMPNHTFARPFVCNTCGKGFRLSSTLCRHKIIHTKDKPYKCHLCEKAFNRSSTLKTHVRTHSLEKEFVCERCGKGFHQKGNLRNHILIHTGEKPYKCTLCHKAFNKLSNLKFHMHVHTENSLYKCSFCKVSFSRRCDLKSHVHTAHAQNESEILKNKTKVNSTC